MAFSEVKRLQLQDAGLLGCYKQHKGLWGDMALEADKATRQYLSSPLQDDIVEHLLPALRVRPEFRACIGQTAVRADKWYRYFAEYILHEQWGSVLAARNKKEGNKKDDSDQPLSA